MNALSSERLLVVLVVLVVGLVIWLAVCPFVCEGLNASIPDTVVELL